MSLEKIEARDQAAVAVNAGLLATRLLLELDYPASATTVDIADVREMIALALSAGRDLAIAEITGDRACRICGCTEFNACDGGCWWIGDDLCSSCSLARPTAPSEGADHGRQG